MTRKLFSIITFALSSASVMANGSFEDLCQSLPDPEPVVTLNKPSVRHDYSLNSMRINRLNADTNSSYRNDDRITTGLVSVDFNTSVGVEVAKVLRDPQGRVCGRPRLKISFSMQKYDLHVGREFKPGSCEFNEILAHEMQHVQVYEQNLPLLRDHFVRMANQFSAPVIFANRDEMSAYLAKLQNYVGLSADNELAAIARLHQYIDTQDEYARLDNACNKNIGNLIER